MKKSIEITGENLTIDDVIQVARFNNKAHLTLDHAIRNKIQASCDFINKAVAEKKLIYGVTTNFGGMANKFISPEHNSISLQENLIWGLKCSVGKKLPVEQIRASMLIRSNALVKGASGIRAELIERLFQFLNAGATPIVREYGSIGASGDLVPLAHIAGAIIGLDASFKVDYLGKEIDALSILNKLKLKPTRLKPKEGLALVNGTSFSAGIAAFCVYEIERLFLLALYAHAFFIQALQGFTEPFDAFVHRLKPHPGQMAVAKIMAELIEGSKFTRNATMNTSNASAAKLIQDRYSVRCLAQYLGPVADTINNVKKQIEIEINSATDNPLIDVDGGMIFQAGNFLSEYVTLGLDQLRYCIALIAKHIDAQIALLVAPEFSHNLPPSLVGFQGSDIQFGLKGLQTCGNSIMPILVHLSNNLGTMFPTHAEQFNQNINSQSFTCANLTWHSAEVMKLYMAISLIFAIQSIELRTYGDFNHYDVRSSLSPALIPLYEAVYKILGCKMTFEKPLIYHNHEQSLDEYVHKIAADLENPNGILFSLIQ